MKQVHNILGNTFFLLPQKAIFWKERETLIVSDLHLGKSHHFRKGGVAIPKTGDYQNLKTLKGLIGIWKPQTVLLLGDLFHSEANKHVLEVIDFIQPFSNIDMKLVVGNHDVMDESWYKALQLEVFQEKLQLDSFLFTHEPMEIGKIPKDIINVCGHIHPSVQLKGKGRQSLNLPCFYFGKHQSILPSFGKFTGSFRIHPTKTDDVYVIVNYSVMKLT